MSLPQFPVDHNLRRGVSVLQRRQRRVRRGLAAAAAWIRGVTADEEAVGAGLVGGRVWSHGGGAAAGGGGGQGGGAYVGLLCGNVRLWFLFMFLVVKSHD